MCRDFELCDQRCDAAAPSRPRRSAADSVRSIGVTHQLHRDDPRVAVFDDAPGRPKQRTAGL
jgi:hypothetical protein